MLQQKFDQPQYRSGGEKGNPTNIISSPGNPPESPRVLIDGQVRKNEMYRIMIVDDEPNILKSLKRALRQESDWEVETYEVVDEALKRIQTATFELVISDYRMPEMDGVEFLSEVRKIQPDAMRLILSGFTDLDALLGAINEAEIYRFICKPWDDFDLITTLKNALALREALVENRRLADEVRQQRKELTNRKTALEKLSERHPKLVEVNWSSDGAIILEEEYLEN